jgi:hypothetical protein
LRDKALSWQPQIWFGGRMGIAIDRIEILL